MAHLLSLVYCFGKLYVTALFIICGTCAVSGCDVLTRTSLGSLCGIKTASEDGRVVHQYLGVPYAEPPIESLRFEHPVPVQKWSTTRDAKTLPPACHQSTPTMSYIRQHFAGFNRASEDCLYINIYIPELKVKKALPVFIWIHGGSNEAGMGAMLPGDILAALGEIIVVNVNYRLDVLGFLTLEDANFPGNIGLLDQIEALTWVQRHISAFSGDPTRVTVAGHSAGALDVGVLMVSPLAEGLFENVIIQSGSAISFWSILNESWRSRYRQNVNKFFQDVGCTSSSSSEIKKCLKQVSIEEIQKQLIPRVDGYPIRHPVVIDNYVLPDEPIKLLENNHSHATSVMLGFTQDEGMYLLGTSVYAKLIRSKDSEQLAHLREYLLDKHFYYFPPSVTDVIMHEYVDWTNPTETCVLAKGCSDLFGDRSFSAPIHRTADALSRERRDRNISTNIFIYNFQFYSPSKFKEIDCVGFRGVPHGDDIFYLFGSPMNGHGWSTIEEMDKKMSRAMIEIWSNFVKNGRPSHPDYPGDTFEEYNSEDRAYIRFYHNDTHGVGVEKAYKYRSRKMAFWNRLIDKLDDGCSSGSSTQLRTDVFLYLVISTVLLCVS